MLLHLSPSRPISEFQEEFTQIYPYLKLEFYERTGSGAGRVHLSHALTLKHAGLRHPGTIDLFNSMTVAELEKKLRDEFSLNAQVCRKSGSLWLETSFTDKWTLGQQNNHGKELSESRSSTRNEDEIDYN